MSDEYFIKKPCQHCPFRRDVKPFLHPERAYEIASHAENPYNSFPCHKTTTSDEEIETIEEFQKAKYSQKECAGFLTMRAKNEGSIPKGFEPAWELIYDDPFQMEDAYQEEWDKTHEKK